jgi:hypothetical protein
VEKEWRRGQSLKDPQKLGRVNRRSPSDSGAGSDIVLDYLKTEKKGEANHV